jgi:hypothetical protein
MARRPDISKYGEARLCRIKNKEWQLVFLKPPDYPYGMSYTLARLITNRHLYGEQHGPPLGVLNRSVIELDRFTNMGIRLKQSWNARIIDDELYLEATVQVYHKEGHEGVFRKSFDEVLPKFKSVVTFVTAGRRTTEASWRLAWRDQGMELLTGHQTLVCYHLDGPRSGRRWRRYETFWELDIFAEPGDALRPRTGNIMSCRYCFTDFRVDFQWHPLDSSGPKGWVLKITRWHQLGNCRSPLDVKWHNYVYRNMWGVAAPRMYSCEAGMVYKKWRAEDGKATGPGVAEDEVVDDELTKAAFSWMWWPIDW